MPHGSPSTRREVVLRRVAEERPPGAVVGVSCSTANTVRIVPSKRVVNAIESSEPSKRSTGRPFTRLRARSTGCDRDRRLDEVVALDPTGRATRSRAPPRRPRRRRRSSPTEPSRRRSPARSRSPSVNVAIATRARGHSRSEGARPHRRRLRELERALVEPRGLPSDRCRPSCSGSPRPASGCAATPPPSPRTSPRSA